MLVPLVKEVSPRYLVVSIRLPLLFGLTLFTVGLDIITLILLTNNQARRNKVKARIDSYSRMALSLGGSGVSGVLVDFILGVFLFWAYFVLE